MLPSDAPLLAFSHVVVVVVGSLHLLIYGQQFVGITPKEIYRFIVNGRFE